MNDEILDLNNWFYSALSLWWTVGANRTQGGFYDAIDNVGSPVLGNCRARVQTRQVYVYAMARSVGWEGPWNQATCHGLEFFMNRFKRKDGLYRTLVSPSGEVIDNGAWLYDQAFALFAMAEATRAGVADLRSEANDLLNVLQDWRLAEGGFLEPLAIHRYQSNPHMHLFEAALAWAEIDQSTHWNNLASTIAELALERFIGEDGALREFFGDGWAKAEGVDGRIIEPGHQFEWAWLLQRWSLLNNAADAHTAAVRLYEIGNLGVDCRGIVTQQLLDDGSVYDDMARLWPQTERIKASIILGEYREAFMALEGLRLYFISERPGLWRDKLRPDGTFVDEPSPASSFYHIACALSQVFRLPRSVDKLSLGS